MCKNWFSPNLTAVKLFSGINNGRVKGRLMKKGFEKLENTGEC
jgi:hypothetical protein